MHQGIVLGPIGKGWWWRLTFDFLFVLLWSVEIHGSSIPIQGVNGVGVRQQLRQERLKDIG